LPLCLGQQKNSASLLNIFHFNALLNNFLVKSDLEILTGLHKTDTFAIYKHLGIFVAQGLAKLKELALFAIA
jgi:hypothetical protein